MNIGDTLIYNGVEYTVWLIEETTAHLLNKNGDGIAVSF
jgi:hypothetical protein